MLHNVPVARILGFLFLGSVVLIGIVTYEGYRTSAGGLAASVHIRFALFAIVVVLFTQTAAASRRSRSATGSPPRSWSAPGV